ncbi:MAG TPA: RAMP superfamily CRISPR-associated protein [Candidatus Obscuribacterales bacterium]
MKLKQLLQTDTPASWQVEVLLDSDLAISSGTGGGAWVDKLVIRDTDGLPCIPGSHFKGVVRDAAERIAQAMGEKTCHAPRADRMCPDSSGSLCIVCRVFGCPQRASSIAFSDLLLTTRELSADTLCRIRNGVSLDRWRKTAMQGRLFSIEVVPSGLTFRGSISHTRPLDARETALLRRALAMVDSLGGNKSRGLGRVTVAVEGA